MTSLFSSTMSPVKDGTSSLPRRQAPFSKPPLRALYDLLIGPMEGVSTRLGWAGGVLGLARRAGPCCLPSLAHLCPWASHWPVAGRPGQRVLRRDPRRC